MKLTDADRAALLDVLELNGDTGEIYPEDVAIYLAGKRAGREDMRERAAKVCQRIIDKHRPLDLYADESDQVIGDAIAAIRALGVDDE